MLQKALAEIERQLCCFRIRISVSRFARVAFKWSYSGLFRADSLARLRAAARLKFCALHTSCARERPARASRRSIALLLPLHWSVVREQSLARSLGFSVALPTRASKRMCAARKPNEHKQASKRASGRPATACESGRAQS